MQGSFFVKSQLVDLTSFQKFVDLTRSTGATVQYCQKLADRIQILNSERQRCFLPLCRCNQFSRCHEGVQEWSILASIPPHFNVPMSPFTQQRLDYISMEFKATKRTEYGLYYILNDRVISRLMTNLPSCCSYGILFLLDIDSR